MSLCHVFPSPPLSDKVIRHRASSLKDTAHAIFASELDPEFGRMCDEIKESWRKRGEEKVKWSQVLERKLRTPAANLNIYQTDIYVYMYIVHVENEERHHSTADVSCCVFILFIASSVFIYTCTFSSEIFSTHYWCVEAHSTISWRGRTTTERPSV